LFGNIHELRVEFAISDKLSARSRFTSMNSQLTRVAWNTWVKEIGGEVNYIRVVAI